MIEHSRMFDDGRFCGAELSAENSHTVSLAIDEEGNRIRVSVGDKAATLPREEVEFLIECLSGLSDEVWGS